MTAIMHIGLEMASPIRIVDGAISRAMANKTVTGKHYDSPLSANLRKLVQRQAEGKVSVWAARFKLNQPTMNRIYNGSSDASVSMLLEISEKTGYAPWQLLHPDFDPAAMPPMMDQRTMRVAAIYANISDPTDKRRAEAIMEQFAPADEVQPASGTSVPRSRSL